MTTPRTTLELNALRVCDAIARIGYTPHAALLDLIDNSISAGATIVRVDLTQNPQKTFAKRGNVIAYAVADNGCGLSRAEILAAFTLGADSIYPPESLSKFGMGLKSAGFSLGHRIRMFSKKAGAVAAFSLDRAVIEETKAWVVEAIEDTKALDEKLKDLVGDVENGTLILIDNTEAKNHQSAQKTIQEISRIAGVTYCGILTEKNIQLNVSCGDKLVAIKPKDILWRSHCVHSYDPATYDCKRPCLVLERGIAIAEGIEEAKLEIVLFPMDKMKGFTGFSEAERDQIKQYDVGTDTKGFFIYRNGRLIRWGDSLDGIVSRNDFGFRARLSLTTAHDDFFHVDVSKQHLNIPEELLSKIEVLCRNPKREHDQLHNQCKQLLDSQNVNGNEFNDRSVDIADDEDPADVEIPPEEVAKRRKRIIENSQSFVEQQQKQNTEVPTQPPRFDKIRYAGDIKGNVIWEAHEHPSDGVFVRLNQNHQFIQLIMNSLSTTDPSRVALESFLWSLGVAEIRTLESADTDFDVLQQTMGDFKRMCSNRLDAWCSRNMDLYDDAQ